MDSIIEQLQKSKSYTVTEIGPEGEKVNTITNYRAINSKTHAEDVIKEIASADLVRSLGSLALLQHWTPPRINLLGILC